MVGMVEGDGYLYTYSPRPYHERLDPVEYPSGLMVPVGLGAHDICIAQQVYLKAAERGLGQMIEL